MGDDMTDEINRIFAEVLSNDRTTVYHCDCCGEMFDIGRNARKHALEEHDDMGCYRSERID